MLPVKNLFVLYTGGTIGMLQTPQGLAPAGGFEARMRDHLQSLGDAPDLRWRFAELQPPLDSANMTQGQLVGDCATPSSPRSTPATTACCSCTAPTPWPTAPRRCPSCS
ncbi:hypothetical protein HMPREF1030_04888, partial [Pseudomonas aeruginosa]